MDQTSAPGPQADDTEIDAFWERARPHLKSSGVAQYTGVTAVESLRPPAWAFGATPAQADDLLGLVLDGTKTATASALAEYEAADEPPPEVGGLGIVLDGRGHPRALVVTTQVRTAPFDEVDDAHAHDEGEGDRSLASWRAGHETFFAGRPGGFSPTMPVVLERFEVLHQE